MRRFFSLLLAGLLLLPAWSAGRAQAASDAPSAESAPSAQRQKDAAVLRFAKHALSRMDERGVSELDVRRTIEKGETFRYYHQSAWKTGYYDPDKKLFIATDGGVVITVITNASRRYVEGLKRKKP